MSASLNASLNALRSAFRANGIVNADEEIAVELGPDAGRLFETWLATDGAASRERAQLNLQVDTWGQTLDADTERPMRAMKLYGVTIKWPVQRLMTQDGTVIAGPFCGLQERRQPTGGRP